MELKNCRNCAYSDGATDACIQCVIRDSDIANLVPSHWAPITLIRDDMVNNPSHYQSETGLETIDVIEAFTSDLKGIEAVDTANILKYICRWKKKNGIQDLKKAKWYLEHLINEVKEKETK